MTIKIDKAGRIVLPKGIRDKLGLRAGSDLEIAESGGSIQLTPRRRGAPLVNRHGLLVHRGELPNGYDWDSLVSEDRAQRLRDVAGL